MNKSCDESALTACIIYRILPQKGTAVNQSGRKWYTMTVKALADMLGTSTATLYRRLKAAGIVIDDYRDEHGELTSEGIQAASALFDGVSADTTKGDAVINADNAATDSAAPSEVAELHLRLEAAQQRIADLESALMAAREDAAAWRHRSEQDAARLDRMLPSGNDGAASARHWWAFWKK